MMQVLKSMAKHEASDLHLKVGYPPYYRVRRNLRKVGKAAIPSSEYIEAMLRPLVPAARMNEYDQHGDTDFSYDGEDGPAADDDHDHDSN